MEVFDTKTFLTILHVFGAVFGAGGAYVSDFMFFSTIRDEKISRTELRFLRLGSKVVWIGLIILVFTGIGLFLSDSEHYLNSSKFLSKMTVVLVILINGFFFHITHLPRMKRHAGGHFPSSDEFMRSQPFLAASGAISFVSWTTALILGLLQDLPYSYGQIIIVYSSVILLAAIFSVIMLHLKHKRRENGK